MRVSFVGPTQSGKTALFCAVVEAGGSSVDVSRADQPHLAVVKVPDARLDWLTEQFRKIHGLNTTFIRQSERLLGDRPCHVLCFRAVRELLMNAVKHAPCSEVVVLAGQFEQNIQIVVRDNGPGFDTSRLGVRVDGSMGFGLLSILEQVRGMGGDFELDSDIGQGTQITLTMPADNTS